MANFTAAGNLHSSSGGRGLGDAVQNLVLFGTPAASDPDAYPLWFLIVYAIISILGILGNLLVIVLIAVIPRLRTPPNIFVLNLCFADILLGFNAVFAFVEEVDAEWVLDGGGCRVFGFISFMPPIAVVLSMVIVAKIRYLAITSVSVNPDKLTRGRVTLYLALIWILSALISLPILMGWVSVRAGLFCACCFYFKENIIYGITVTTTVYIIPNILILYFYIRIFMHVRKSRMRVQQHQGTQGTARKADIQLARQFIVLFCIFNICYTPTMIVFWVEDEYNSLSVSANAVIMLIFALNLILNPLAYFAFNKGARRETAKCCRGKKANWSADTRSRSQEGARDSHVHSYVAEPSPQSSVDQPNSNRNKKLPITKDDPDKGSEANQNNPEIQSPPVRTTTELNSYLLIACGGSLSNSDMSTMEHSVNKDKKPAVDKGYARPPPNATVFLDPQAYYLAVPRRRVTSRDPSIQTGQQGQGADTLRLERLSVVSFAESFEESSEETAYEQDTSTRNDCHTDNNHSHNKLISRTPGPVVQNTDTPTVKQDCNLDSGFKE